MARFRGACTAFFLILLMGCGGETAPTSSRGQAVSAPTPTTRPTMIEATETLSTSCAPRTERPLRYLALGDSYTIGEGVSEAERWPVQLVSALRGQNVNIEDAEIIARTGWTTAELQNGISQAKPQGSYDLVSLLIGVNNQYRGLSQEAYREEFVELLQTAVSLAGNNPQKVFVVSIPDWGVTPFAQGRNREEIGAEIDAFNGIGLLESGRLGVTYIDITDISREAAEDEGLTAVDGLHPSGKMYRLWVERMQPVVCGLLGKIETGD